MESTFTFDLVTPQATFFSGKASLVEAPGTLGDFGVLPGHMNFISTLRAGVVNVHSEHADIMRVFVAGGIAEVNPLSCTILAEHAEDMKNISREEADTRMARAKAALAEAGDDAREAVLRGVEMAEALSASFAQ